MSIDHDDIYKLGARLRVRYPLDATLARLARQLDAIGDAMAAQGVTLDVSEAPFEPA